MDITESGRWLLSNELKPLRVTVFGGSQPQKGESSYNEALKLGELLGRFGCAVLTGGYIGTMEAVSHGAARAGGHVIGVTCDEIETWRPVQPNSWVMEELRYPTLRERLFALIEQCDVAFALPGGIGTMEEITVMWAQLQVGAIEPRPLILIGTEWKTVIDTFYSVLSKYIARKDRQWVNSVTDVDEAMELLLESFPTT